MDLVISTNIIPEEINTRKISSYKTLPTVYEFEAHINEAPRVYDNLYVDDISVAFNPSALNTFYKLLTNGFINIKTLYYITTKQKTDAIQVFQNIFKDINFEIIDVKSIDTNTVTSVVNGSLSGSEETTFSTINKVKLKDYIKGNKSEIELDSDVSSIDDSLTKLHDSLELEKKKHIINIVDFDRYYTAYYMLFVFNNLQTNSKVFTMEFDKYNFLSDYITKLKSAKYITDINAISSNESCLFLNKDTNNADYNSIFDYVYNVTNFDIYLRVVSCDNLSINMRNTHYVLNPVVDSVVKLIEILFKSSAKHADIVLLYKGFIGINELTASQVKQIINQNVDTEVDIISIIIKEDKR